MATGLSLAGPIVSVIGAEASMNNSLETVTVKVNWPAAVGVPERRPSRLRVSPRGNAPAVTANRPRGSPAPDANG